MAHATTAHLQTFVGQAVTLPADAARLLDRATDLVDRVTLKRYDVTKTRHATALQNAACAQVEYWLDVGESVDVTGPAGRIQNKSTSYEAYKRLAPRAKDFLLTAGLLYAGVGQI